MMKPPPNCSRLWVGRETLAKVNDLSYTLDCRIHGVEGLGAALIRAGLELYAQDPEKVKALADLEHNPRHPRLKNQ